MNLKGPSSVSTGGASAPGRVSDLIMTKPRRDLTKQKLVQATNADKFYSGSK